MRITTDAPHRIARDVLKINANQGYHVTLKDAKQTLIVTRLDLAVSAQKVFAYPMVGAILNVLSVRIVPETVESVLETNVLQGVDVSVIKLLTAIFLELNVPNVLITFVK